MQFAGSPPGTVKLVCGNTSYGVEKYFNATGVPTPYSAFIDVTGGCMHGGLVCCVGFRLGHVSITPLVSILDLISYFFDLIP